MDGIVQLLPKLLSGGMFGAGEIGNILEERKRSQYQNMVMDLIAHPEKLAAMVAKLKKPLDNALVQGVSNTVQGNLAERGLGQAPGIYTTSLAQGLAPYEQQNEQTALDAVMRTLGLPAGTFGQPANMTGALQLFLNQFGKKGNGVTGSGAGPVEPGFTLPATDPIWGDSNG